MTFSTKKVTAAPWVLFLFSFLIGLIAISNQSLWIDEAHSAFKASQPDFHSFWKALYADKGSDLQMPFYMCYLWTWSQFFGFQEWALRLANLPWFLLAQWAWIFSLRHNPRLAFFATLLSAIHPLVWAYLNEARPYIMQYGCASCLTAGIFYIFDNPNFRLSSSFLWGFFIAGVILLGSSLLTLPFVGAAFLFLLFGIWKQKQIKFSDLIYPMATALLLSLLLGGFYFWTLRSGARASAVGSTQIANGIYAGYELLGFSGLGPGRLLVREQGIKAFEGYEFPLFLFFLILSYILIKGSLVIAKSKNFQIEKAKAWLVFFFIPLLSVFLLGTTAHFRVLGRHLMPALPVLILYFAGCVNGLADKRSVVHSLFIALFFAGWLLSSISIRFSQRHSKDDYRNAAETAKEALQKRENVWWIADPAAASYYGLKEVSSSRDSHLEMPISISSKALPKFQTPDLIILSRPDTFDGSGTIQRFIHEKGYYPTNCFQSFVIFMK